MLKTHYLPLGLSFDNKFLAKRLHEVENFIVIFYKIIFVYLDDVWDV